MISDILSDAIDAIHDYQRDFSEIYDAEKVQLDRLLAHMDHVRAHYDTPPKRDQQGNWISPSMTPFSP